MRPQGFPRALRIRRGSDFDRVFRAGGRAADALLAVHALPNGGPHPRLGLAVGRGIGGAVVRNRVKRLLREAFRIRRGDLPPSHDLVVVARGTDPAAWTRDAAEASLLALAPAAAARVRPRSATDAPKRKTR